MLTSERVAIAAHLHVVLRRRTGRVTDTEWMATNTEYAAEIVRFARTRALEDGHEDLAMWAGKLEAAMADVKPVRRSSTSDRPTRPAAPPAWTDSQRQRMEPVTEISEATSGFGQSTFGETGFLESTFGPPSPRRRDPDSPRYIGGLR